MSPYKTKKNPKNDYYGYCFMSCDELIRALGNLNSSWMESFVESKKDLIDEAHKIESEIEKNDEIIKKTTIKDIKLKASKLKISEAIIESFKESIDLDNIPVNQKKFIYKNEESLNE